MFESIVCREVDEETLAATRAASPSLSERTSGDSGDEPLYQIWFSVEVVVAPGLPEKTIEMSLQRTSKYREEI